jgi:selenocysteine lyase/cysteine desulfurase
VALARELREGIERLGFDMFTPPDNPSPIVSFTHGRDPEEVKRILQKENVHVTLREENTQIRASVALFNNRADIARLVDVLAKMA